MRLASVSFSLVGSRLAQSSTLLIATTQSVIVVGGARKRDAGCALTPAADRADASIATATTHSLRPLAQQGGRKGDALFLPGAARLLLPGLDAPIGARPSKRLLPSLLRARRGRGKQEGCP